MYVIRRDAMQLILSAALPKEKLQMETSARVLNITIRVCWGAALALGLAFWLGYARSLTMLHIRFGIGVVLSLWALAVIAWWKTTRHNLALFATAWGLATLVFGMTQIQLMPGPFHWIVEVAHLGVGVVAIALGAQLANAITLGRTPTGHVAERASSNVT
jgi:hypothetical protein